MKIACLGNMNNNMFSLVRFLRDAGYEADLFLLTEQAHFLPECDTFRINDYSFIKEISNFPWPNLEEKKFGYFDKVRLKAQLKKYEVFIGCGYAPSLLNYLNLKLDIFVPYGSDYYMVPFEKEKNFAKNKYYRSFAHYQLIGIQNSKLVICEKVPIVEHLFDKIPLNGKRLKAFFPCIYSTDFNLNTISNFFGKSLLYSKLKKIREENDFIVLQQVRQTWKTNHDGVTNKGNDKLIAGFADFVINNPGIKAKLLLFEYGDDVDLSKKMIKDLSIDSYVIWIPLSPRKEIMVAIYFADVCVGELHDSFFLYGSIAEYLSMSKPFIHSCKWEDFKDIHSSCYPLNYANSAEQVSEHLTFFWKNNDKAKTVGEEGYKWFIKNVIDGPLQTITNYIDAK